MDPNNMHLPVGMLLANGKYRIVRFIGAGGFGCTYEAEFVPMGSRVAIKEFFVNTYCNRDATGTVSLGVISHSFLVNKLEEKFQTEAKRLFQLKHSGIVSVIDMFRENGTSYYVMDYIDGVSLQGLINREGPLSEGRAMRYISQVMDALEYVHSHKMLHLDVKPDNIMIDSKDNAILIDFGVSKQYDEIDGHNTSTIMGLTPGYAPPEQVGNSVRQFTPAADIYALGATLYTALTGMAPPSSADIISGVAYLAPLPKHCSPLMHRAIGSMMQPNVNRRPQTIEAVRALLSGRSVNSQVPNPVPPVAPEYPSGPKNISNPVPPVPPVPPVNSATVAVNSQSSKRKSKIWLWIVIAAVSTIGIFVGAIYLLSRESYPDPDSDYEMTDDYDPSEAVVEEVVEVEEVYDDSLAYYDNPYDAELAIPPTQPAQQASDSDSENLETNLYILNEGIRQANQGFPQQMDDGMVMVRCYLDGDYLMYLVHCDEDLYDIDMLNSSKDTMKQFMKETFRSNSDTNVTVLKMMCVNAHKGIAFNYTGTTSGKSCIVRVPYSELK